MKTRLRWTLLVLLALSAPLASSASAMTMTTVSSGNNRQIVGQFTFPDTVTCAEGTFTVKRLEYKIGEGEWADPSTVADEVSVRVRMVLAPPR